MRKRISTAFALLLLSANIAAQQVEEKVVQIDAEEVPPEQEAAQRPIATERPVVFNGGISIEERAEAPDGQGTKLEFFDASGAYLSQVHVRIEDSTGEQLVDTVTDGPWLIVDLPAGQYNVQASLDDGGEVSNRIDVTADQQKFGYMFPAN